MLQTNCLKLKFEQLSSRRLGLIVTTNYWELFWKICYVVWTFHENLQCICISRLYQRVCIRKQDEKVGNGEREDAIRLQPYKEPAHLLAKHARRVGRAIPAGSAELLILRPRVSSRYVDLPVNHVTKQPPRPSCRSNSRESRLECTWLPFRNPRLTQSSNNTSDTLYP